MMVASLKFRSEDIASILRQPNLTTNPFLPLGIARARTAAKAAALLLSGLYSLSRFAQLAVDLPRRRQSFHT